MEKKRQNKILFPLISVSFLFTLGIGVFTFAFPLLAFQKDMPSGLLGILFSGYFLAKILLSPVAGNLADRFFPRPFLLAALFIATLLPFLYFFHADIKVLYTIQFTLGLCAGFVKPITLAIIAGLGKTEQHGRFFAWTNTASNIAFFLGPLVGGLIFYSMQIRPVLLFLSTVMFLCLLLIFTFVPQKIRTRSQPANKPISQKRTGGFTLFLAVAGRSLGIAGLIVFFPIALSHQFGSNKILIGVLTAIPALTSCVLLPLGGKLADTGRRDILTLLGMSLSALGLFLLGQVTTLPLTICVAILLGTGTAISFPAAMALGTNLNTQTGKNIGLLQAASGTGFILGPILCGIIIEFLTNIAPAFAVLGMLGLLSCLPFTFQLRDIRLKIKIFICSLLSVLCLLTAIFGLQHIPIREIFQKTKPQINKSSTSQPYANLAMGGIVSLQLYGEPQKTDPAAKQAFTLIAELEKDFGHRTAYGSIGKINAAAGEKAVAVTPQAFSLLERAIEIGKKTNGIFDISIGAVTILPYYYRQKASKEKTQLVDYTKIRLNPKTQTVFLPQKGMALDVGGLAKGSIIDAAANSIRNAGIQTALIEGNGDFFCYGEKNWRIGIQDPRSPELLGVIEVKNVGVCGSGDYYQYIDDENGERSHHILDPENLHSANASIGVTAIAPTAELADALATTLFIAGPQKGIKLLKNFPDCSALWVKPDKTLVFSPNFPKFLPTKK